MSLWGIPVDEEGLQKKRMKISAFQRQGLTSFSAKWPPPPPPFRFTISNFLGEFGILPFQLHSSSFFTGFCICSKSKSLLLSHTHCLFLFQWFLSRSTKKGRFQTISLLSFYLWDDTIRKEVEKLMDTSESCWVKCHFSYLVFQFIFDKMNNEWNGRTVVDRKT